MAFSILLPTGLHQVQALFCRRTRVGSYQPSRRWSPNQKAVFDSRSRIGREGAVTDYIYVWRQSIFELYSDNIGFLLGNVHVNQLADRTTGHQDNTHNLAHVREFNAGTVFMFFCDETDFTFKAIFSTLQQNSLSSSSTPKWSIKEIKIKS